MNTNKAGMFYLKLQKTFHLKLASQKLLQIYPPVFNTSKQTLQTRTGLFSPNFIMGTS